MKRKLLGLAVALSTVTIVVTGFVSLRAAAALDRNSNHLRELAKQSAAYGTFGLAALARADQPTESRSGPALLVGWTPFCDVCDANVDRWRELHRAADPKVVLKVLVFGEETTVPWVETTDRHSASGAVQIVPVHDVVRFEITTGIVGVPFTLTLNDTNRVTSYSTGLLSDRSAASHERALKGARETLIGDLNPVLEFGLQDANSQPATLACIKYEPAALRVREEKDGTWAVADTKQVLARVRSEKSARIVLQLASGYAETCYIGRRDLPTRLPVQYWTGGPGKLHVPPSVQDCAEYDPAVLEIRQSGPANWQLISGKGLLLVAGTKADAEAAMKVAARHRAQCFVGRDERVGSDFSNLVRYWR
jgi:hypothetical protein